jgi:hypothetical protein
MNGQLHAQAAIPKGGKAFGTQWKGGLVCPTTGLDDAGKRMYGAFQKELYDAIPNVTVW